LGVAAAAAAPPTPIGAGGAIPTGTQLVAAMALAMATLSTANRPGPAGLLLHEQLVAVLRTPPAPGFVPVLEQVESLIGSNAITGTGALDGSLRAGAICGVLFRLDPPAVDIVRAQLPRISVLGRAGGFSQLRVEEDIAVRIVDTAAIQQLAY
jgi:hypothetical protein